LTTDQPGDAATNGSTSTREESLRLALEVARGADLKKAEDVLILDISSMSGVADFFVICTARSTKQVAVIAEACDLAARRLGGRARAFDGMETGWVVADFLDVILHVFDEPSRQFYDLEHLWADAPRVEWAPEAMPLPKKAATPSE
jgi:ribosome-associated protein